LEEADCRSRSSSLTATDLWTGRIEPAISQGQRALAVDFEIKPLKGVGAIEFGMSPAEVSNSSAF
jgi:hypothetical protein